MVRYGDPPDAEEREAERRREGCSGCLADIGCMALVTWLLPCFLLVMIV